MMHTWSKRTESLEGLRVRLASHAPCLPVHGRGQPPSPARYNVSCRAEGHPLHLCFKAFSRPCSSIESGCMQEAQCQWCVTGEYVPLDSWKNGTHCNAMKCNAYVSMSACMHACEYHAKAHNFSMYMYLWKLQCGLARENQGTKL